MSERHRTIPLILFVFVFLIGCARFSGEPMYLEFPDEPHLVWTICQAQSGASMLCLSEADAGKLAKWVDKLRAFEHARARLIKK